MKVLLIACLIAKAVATIVCGDKRYPFLLGGPLGNTKF